MSVSDLSCAAERSSGPPAAVAAAAAASPARVLALERLAACVVEVARPVGAVEGSGRVPLLLLSGAAGGLRARRDRPLGVVVVVVVETGASSEDLVDLVDLEGGGEGSFVGGEGGLAAVSERLGDSEERSASGREGDDIGSSDEMSLLGGLESLASAVEGAV